MQLYGCLCWRQTQKYFLGQLSFQRIETWAALCVWKSLTVEKNMVKM